MTIFANVRGFLFDVQDYQSHPTEDEFEISFSLSRPKETTDFGQVLTYIQGFNHQHTTYENTEADL